MSVSLVPNEILVRFDENGKFQAAHTCDLKLIKDETGAIVHRELMSPKPISTRTDPAFIRILGTTLTKAISGHRELSDKISKYEQEEPPAVETKIVYKNKWTPLVIVGVVALLETSYVALHLIGLVH